MGNWELLAIHAALTEWRHWLEGAQHPILIWTDHKNLTYIRDAKRLGLRQARWALFFCRFDFTLTYRPGFKNVRAYAQSRLFPTETPNRSPAVDTILSPAWVVGVITWGVESAVRMAQPAQPDSGRGPRNCLFVPTSVRSQVLQWGHASQLSCHPGATRTEEFIRLHFWWPTLEADTREFVATCNVCSCSKASHRPPAGLLCPLPIPGRLWSHIALDFVTGLPTSKGNNTIMTVVDRFLKMVHFIALHKLPSTAETADLLVTHVVRLHGIPQNIVSDHCPQFTSGV